MTINRFLRILVVLLFLFLCYGELISMESARGLLALVIISSLNRKYLYRFGPLKLWVFPLAFVFFAPFLVGEKTSQIFGVGYSINSLKIGAGFLFRTYLFVVTTNFIIGELTMERVVENAKKFGLPGAGLRIALALSMTKTIQRSILETWRIYRLTRPGIFSALREIHVYLGAIARNSARVAEQVSELFYLRNVDI